MIYNIEDQILFDAHRNTLTHIATQECISLTISQALLLELFLESNSEVLPRDKILDLFWKKNGINTSGNTLNQYISLLRKLFIHFGLDEVISTLPKVGFRLNPDVRISLVADVDIPDLTVEAPLPESAEEDIRDTPGKGYLIALLAIFFSGLLVKFIYYQYGTDDRDFSYINEKNCEIGLTRQFAREDQAGILNQTKMIMNDNKLLCSNKRVSFFDFSKSTSGKDYGRALLAYCIKGDDGNVLSCENYYYRNWRVE